MSDGQAGFIGGTAVIDATRRGGRIIGVLLYFQLVGLIAPFILLLPLTGGHQSYLANAAGAAVQTKAAVFLLFGNCALTIGITIAAMQWIRRYSEALAQWLLALSVIMFVLQAVDNIHILAMLSLSQQYAQAGGGEAMFQALAAAVGSTRKWSHLTALLAIDGWIFVFYGILYRFTMVPRALAGFGLITVLLHVTAIPFRGFVGAGPVALLGMPMALSHMTLAIWMTAKGFADRSPARRQTPGGSGMGPRDTGPPFHSGVPR